MNPQRERFYLDLEFLFDWISIQESAKTVSQVLPFPVQQHWQRPLPGFVKCNIDAAVFREEGKSSWGIVVRDSQGLFLHAASRVVNGLFQVRELETLGLREVLSWIKQLGFERVIFETTHSKQFKLCRTELLILVSLVF